MTLKDVLDKFEYNNIIYKNDETIVVENCYRTVVTIDLHHTKKHYSATIPSKHGIDPSNRIQSNNYDAFLKLLEDKLESKDPFKNMKFLK